ncbi:MAG: hypothetical protein WAM85_04355 [Terracidiphilus sp.]
MTDWKWPLEKIIQTSILAEGERGGEVKNLSVPVAIGVVQSGLPVNRNAQDHAADPGCGDRRMRHG